MTILLAVLPGTVAHAGASADHAMATADVETRDFVPLPPIKRQSVSPNGRYVFLAQSSDGWQSRYATGRLLENTPAGPVVVWERVLQQEYGPRYFLVSNQGQVVLFDESINVKSRYAIVLLTPRKNLEITHNFEAVAQTLGVPVAAIVERAKSGWWLQGEPAFDAAGTHVMVAVAGICLVLDLATGRLSRASTPPPPKCRP